MSLADFSANDLQLFKSQNLDLDTRLRIDSSSRSESLIKSWSSPKRRPTLESSGIMSEGIKRAKTKIGAIG